MLIALVADSHYDERSRFAECIRLHNWIAEDAKARGVTLTLHAGDLYERKSTPLERQAAAAWVQQMAALGPFVIGRGNHDAVDDLPLLEKLETTHPVFVYERAGLCEHLALSHGIAIAVLGWPQRAHLHAALEAAGVKDASHEMVENAAGEALRAVLRGLGDKLAQWDCPKILLAHAMVRGSKVSTGQPLVGCDFEIGLEDLALARADAYLLGHIHYGQAWKIGDAPCIYPGSPRRKDFGEIEPKGYTLIDVDEHGIIACEFVEVPATPMIHVETNWTGETFDGGWEQLDTIEGAEVRFRYHVTSDQRDAAAGAAAVAREWLLKRAVVVKVEEVVETTTRSRTPEVAAAVTLADKLQCLWRARGFDPGERREALLAKLSTVEEEARNAA